MIPFKILLILSVGCCVTYANGNKILSEKLPKKIIIGYADNNECDQLLVRAVKQGVNVLIWFSINLMTDREGNPIITGGPDLSCVRQIKEQIREMKLPTIHLISIGGWNAPHPDTSNPPDIVYNNWVKWNNDTFDGFDWDIEGNDDLSSPYNQFTLPCLDLMGQMSQLAKKDGYLVSMVPAESYLDPTTSAFDLYLNHSYPEWETLEPNFLYHGHNAYAYLLIKYGTTLVNKDATDTFDFVTIQLYEGYSHADYNITVGGQTSVSYLQNWIPRVYAGWDLQIPSKYISTDWGTGSSDVGGISTIRVSVSPSRLVIGLANGWAGDGKFLLIYPDQVGDSHRALETDGLAPRGYAFWVIKEEGTASVEHPDVPVWMASGFNEFLHTRLLDTINNNSSSVTLL